MNYDLWSVLPGLFAGALTSLITVWRMRKSGERRTELRISESQASIFDTLMREQSATREDMKQELAKVRARLDTETTRCNELAKQLRTVEETNIKLTARVAVLEDRLCSAGLPTNGGCE